MAYWNYNPNEYSARNFEPIPEGDYRVRINDVKEKAFSTGKEGFEIMLDVTGQVGRLWYYLVIDPNDSLKTNQRIGMFFDSFAIHDEDLSHYENWRGKDGAVRVRHTLYNGEIMASVAFCLSRSQQKKFPGFNSSNTNQHSITTNPSNSYSEQHNRFNGFSNHSAAHREFPEGFIF